MRLIINGVLIPIENPSRLAQTKQVNDLLSINSRKTNITNAIKIPRTAETELAFQLLGIVGNNSNIPYVLNKVYLYSDFGECFIFDGRLIVLDTQPDYYNTQIIDGNIDLAKAIDNAKLSDLPLDEITHLKNVANILASWEGETDYRYIVADYNGKMLIDADTLNADYLTPSVRLPYLWQKIHDFYGFTYAGSVFGTEDFQNSWLTFPKGIVSGEASEDIFISNDWNFTPTSDLREAIRLRYNSYTVFNLASSLNASHLRVADSGSYKLTITGRFTTTFDNPFKILLGKNQDSEGNPDFFTEPFLVIDENGVSGEDFEHEVIFNLEANDSINLFLKKQQGSIGNPNPTGIRFSGSNNLDFKLEKIQDSVIDFSDAFIDFETKDFFKDVINRFCLIPIKNKYSNLYTYYTFDEIIRGDRVLDWSEKFSFLQKDVYVYGSYKKSNYFRYKYNDKEGDHNDGFISVQNETLDEKGDLFISRIYSPEILKTNIFGRLTNVYKMWDKTIKDNSEVEYKSLDKRFYIMRSTLIETDTERTITSEFTSETDTFTSYPAEAFTGLDYNSIINRYYSNIGTIINRSLLQTVSMYLNDKDVCDVDFSSLIFIKQLGGYFILNKITNYTGGDSTSVELIKVKYAEETTGDGNNNIITDINYVLTGANTWDLTIDYDASRFEDIDIVVNVNGQPYAPTANTGIANVTVIALEDDILNVFIEGAFIQSETKQIILL